MAGNGGGMLSEFGKKFFGGCWNWWNGLCLFLLGL